MGLFDSIFGGGSSGKVQTIDPNQVIQTQAQANRVGQTTPFGSLSFSGPLRNELNFQVPGLNQELMGRLFRAQRQGSERAAGMAGKMLGELDSDTVVNAQLERLAPFFEQQQARLRNSLEQSGNPAAFGGQFSEGAFNELALLNQGQNDARLAAIAQGPQIEALRTQQALALLNGSAVGGPPQFNYQGAGPLDVNGAFGLAQNAQIANAKNARADRGGFLGGLFDLGVEFPRD